MKYIWITIVVLFSVFSACGLGAVQQFTHIPDAQVEEIMLKVVQGAAREGKILKLQTGAKTVSLEDRIDVGEGSAKYYLAGFMDTHGDFYLIRVLGHESKGYVLVNKKSGQTIDLYSKPVFSPDGNRFVDISLDLEAGHMSNLIIIYELKGDKYSQEWKHVFQGIKGPSNPVWLNNSAIVFFEVTFNKVPTFSNLKKKPFIIELENNRWQTPRPLNEFRLPFSSKSAFSKFRHTLTHAIRNRD